MARTREGRKKNENEGKDALTSLMKMVGNHDTLISMLTDTENRKKLFLGMAYAIEHKLIKDPKEILFLLSLEAKLKKEGEKTSGEEKEKVIKSIKKLVVASEARLNSTDNEKKKKSLIIEMYKIPEILEAPEILEDMVFQNNGNSDAAQNEMSEFIKNLDKINMERYSNLEKEQENFHVLMDEMVKSFSSIEKNNKSSSSTENDYKKLDSIKNNLDQWAEEMKKKIENIDQKSRVSLNEQLNQYIDQYKQAINYFYKQYPKIKDENRIELGKTKIASAPLNKGTLFPESNEKKEDEFNSIDKELGAINLNKEKILENTEQPQEIENRNSSSAELQKGNPVVYSIIMSLTKDDEEKNEWDNLSEPSDDMDELDTSSEFNLLSESKENKFSLTLSNNIIANVEGRKSVSSKDFNMPLGNEDHKVEKNKNFISAWLEVKDQTNNLLDKKLCGIALFLQFCVLKPDAETSLVLQGTWDRYTLEQVIDCCRITGRDYKVDNILVTGCGEKGENRVSVRDKKSILGNSELGDIFNDKGKENAEKACEEVVKNLLKINSTAGQKNMLELQKLLGNKSLRGENYQFIRNRIPPSENAEKKETSRSQIIQKPKEEKIAIIDDDDDSNLWDNMSEVSSDDSDNDDDDFDGEDSSNPHNGPS